MLVKKWCLVVAFAAGLAAAGCKSKEQADAEAAAVKADQDKLQGKWKVASRTGDADEDAPEPSSYYVIEGDLMKMVFADAAGQEEVISRQKLALMPGKDPKQVDMTYVDEAGKPITSTDKVKSKITGKKKTKTTTLKNVGVYKIDGDKVTFNIAYDDKRPTDFTAPPGSSRYTLTLQKMGDKEKPPAAVPTDPAKDKDMPKEKDKADEKPKG